MVSWRILDYFVVAGYLVLTAGAAAGPAWIVSYHVLCHFLPYFSSARLTHHLLRLWRTDLSYYATLLEQYDSSSGIQTLSWTLIV